MAIVLKNCKAINNGGDGLRVVTNGRLDLRVIDFVAEGNGGNGVQVIDLLQLRHTLSLSHQEIADRDLGESVERVRRATDQDREAVLRKTLLGKALVAKGVLEVGAALATILGVLRAW
jgi:hypothetical protein